MKCAKATSQMPSKPLLGLLPLRFYRAYLLSIRAWVLHLMQATRAWMLPFALPLWAWQLMPVLHWVCMRLLLLSAAEKLPLKLSQLASRLLR